jgi:hypothetical protein
VMEFVFPTERDADAMMEVTVPSAGRVTKLGVSARVMLSGVALFADELEHPAIDTNRLARTAKERRWRWFNIREPCEGAERG